MRKLSVFVLTTLLILGIAGMANANLISNGTFDTDLSGWTQGGTIATTWDSGTAHLGRPGTNGQAIFSQAFGSGGAPSLEIKFDYEWQIIAPTIEDVFTVNVNYTGSGGAVNQQIFTQGSTTGSFGTTVPFSTTLALATPVTGNVTLEFVLDENNTSNGTRIQLDNVEVNAVPIPGAALLLGSGLIGLFGVRRKFSK